MFTLIPGVTVIGVPPQAHETCKPFHPANVEGEWSHEHLRVGPEASLLHSLTYERLELVAFENDGLREKPPRPGQRCASLA